MSILEVLIGTTIITVGILALTQVFGVYVKYALSHDKYVQVAYLLEEGVEALTLLRDDGWNANIVPIGTATTSLYWNGSKWTVSSTTDEYIGGTFVRNIRLSPVNRDGTGKIAATGTPDPNTKLVTVYVSYFDPATTTESLSKYLINIHNN